MHASPHPEVSDLLSSLLERLRQALDGELLGVYLYGSAATGEFDPGVSDVDLLAVTLSDGDGAMLVRLQGLHDHLARDRPQWRDRLDVAYLSMRALKTFRRQASTIAIISPGEPLHLKEAGREYLMNWWQVRERGITVLGPPPTTFIEPISAEEFLASVTEHARHWREWVKEMRHPGGQAYAVLTLCRALYASTTGEQASKARAAGWAKARYPDWASAIERALEWRKGNYGEGMTPEAAFAATVSFVRFATAQIIPHA